jgi:hypothetical protein
MLILCYSHSACSCSQYVTNTRTLWYATGDAYQLLHVSARRCHPQGVITTKVYKATCQSTLCSSLQQWLRSETAKIRKVDNDKWQYKIWNNKLPFACSSLVTHTRVCVCVCVCVCKMCTNICLESLSSGKISTYIHICVCAVYMNNTGLLKIIVVVLTTCHTQYTWDRSM